MKRPILTPLLIGFGIWALSVLGGEIASLRARIAALESAASSSVQRTGQFRAVMVPCTSVGDICTSTIEVYK